LSTLLLFAIRFFFSCRRRHTRSKRDWSSDVCSSDLHPWSLRSLPAAPTRVLDVGCGRGELVGALIPRAGLVEGIDPDAAMGYAKIGRASCRKEWRSRWSPLDDKDNNSHRDEIEIIDS